MNCPFFSPETFTLADGFEFLSLASFCVGKMGPGDAGDFSSSQLVSTKRVVFVHKSIVVVPL